LAVAANTNFTDEEEVQEEVQELVRIGSRPNPNSRTASGSFSNNIFCPSNLYREVETAQLGPKGGGGL
jgi:hypothetical protein